jgi:hypothetical protein
MMAVIRGENIIERPIEDLVPGRRPLKRIEQNTGAAAGAVNPGIDDLMAKIAIEKSLNPICCYVNL